MVMTISKDQLEKSFKNKSYVELEDLVQLIEDNFGFSVTLKKKNNLSDDLKKKMTSEIFKDEGVLYQLRQAKKDQEEGMITYSDSQEEFAKLLSEVDNDK
jgi:hypothetical protein